MSSSHGSQGQPFARPGAQAQDQWGQPVRGAAGSHAPAQNGYANPQGYAPQAQPNLAGSNYGQGGLGQPMTPAPQGYGGGYGQAADYNAPQAPPQQRASNYAPQFEPFSAAPLRPQPQPAYQPAAAPQSYGQQGYGQQGYEYGAPSQAPQPYGAPAHQAHATQAHLNQGHQSYGHQAPAPAQNWRAPQPDPRGFDLGTYNPSPQPSLSAHTDPSLQANDWSQGGYQGDAGYDQNGAEYAQGDFNNEQGGADLGFGQAAGGELDQGYTEEEAQDYEPEAPSRMRRPLTMVAVLAGAIVLGGGLTYGYKAILGGPSAGEPPVIKSAAAPTKVKPQDGGGKQFSHADSKIMGRLGDGSGAAAAVADGAEPAAAGETDSNGTRKVATLVVGRDGSIQAPSAAPAEAPEPAQGINVPGMTVVDGLGSRAPAAAATMANAASAPRAATQDATQDTVQQVAAAAPAKVVANPPAAQKPVTIAKVAAPQQEMTGSIEGEAAQAAAPAAPVAKPKKVKAAAAAPAAAPAADAASTSVATTGSGFVAVLASVPRSTSSRMDALKRFADMQQKYGGVLTGKTPDVAEANLGTKGSYHRLVVGPPGSREQASTVCSQLKTQGYADCWVTSY